MFMKQMSENEHKYFNIFLVKLHRLYVAIIVIVTETYFLTHIALTERAIPSGLPTTTVSYKQAVSLYIVED